MARPRTATDRPKREPAAHTRRGACPALTAPMPTGDGLLVRVNTIAGSLPPRLLIGLCELAQRHGNGIVEVTARGSFQIRGLTDQSALALASDVNALAIPVRTGVPIDMPALAGLDRDEVTDARPIVDALRHAINAAGLAPRLGPKVSVVIDGGGHSALASVASDVRLTATGTSTWAVAVGGDAQSARLFATRSEADAVTAATALLSRIADLGIEARGRDLAMAAVLDDPSPATCRTEGRATASGSFSLNPGTALPLSDNRHALPIALPFGSSDAAALIALARRAMAEGVADIRLAPNRLMLLLCPSPVAVEGLRQEAEARGFIVSPADPRAHIAACPGKPACASGHIATRDIAQAFAGVLGELSRRDGMFGNTPEGSDVSAASPDLSIHISGCAKGCARQAAASITLVGGENGAGLVVAGTAKDLPLAYIPANDVAQGLARLATGLRACRLDGETTAATLARLGGDRAAVLFRRERP